jgi:hypothetical protein
MAPFFGLYLRMVTNIFFPKKRLRIVDPLSGT